MKRRSFLKGLVGAVAGLTLGKGMVAQECFSPAASAAPIKTGGPVVPEYLDQPFRVWTYTTGSNTFANTTGYIWTEL